MESATKDAGVHILVAKSTEQGLSFDLDPLDPIYVKGKEEPIEVFTWDTK